MGYGRATVYIGVRVFLFLSVAWVLFSPQMDWLSLTTGFGSSALVTALLLRMGIMDAEVLPVRLSWGLASYVVLLITEIVRSNFFVARLILNPRARVRSKLILVPLKPGKNVSKVVFANSVTLTPGTITIAEDLHSLNEDEAFIHALDDSSSDIEALKDFQDRIRGLS